MADARKQKNISLSEVAKITKINLTHLQALEDCRFDDIPHAMVYQKNFIRKYSEAIGVDPSPLLAQFCTEETTNKDKKSGYKKIKRNSLHNLPVILRGVISFSIVLIVITYVGWQVKSIVDPPPLAVYRPNNGYVTNLNSLIVQGETTNEAQVYINGQEIGTDPSGKFEEIINLSPGINAITISAKKKHGKKSEDTRHVILKQNNHLSYNETKPLDNSHLTP